MEILGLIDVPIWLLLLLGVIVLIYVWGTSTFGTFTKMGVPGPKPYPVVGSMLPALTTYSDFKKFDRDLVEKYGKFVGIYEGKRPVLLVSDLECMKQIFVKDFNNFGNRQEMIDESLMEEPFDKMMSTLTGDHWKHVRNLITPTFTTGKLKRMVPVMNSCAEQLVENIQELAEKKEDIDTSTHMGNFTMDVIAKTAFGLDVNTQKESDSPFVTMAKRIMTPKAYLMIILFMAPWIFTVVKKWFGYNMFDQVPGQFFSKVVKQAMEERKNNKNKEHVDFLQLMMNAHVDKPTAEDVADEELADTMKYSEADVWTTKGLTEEEIVSQAVMFFFAGYGTTSDTLNWLCYELAVNPEVQDKLMQEVDEVTNGAPVTADMVNKMYYMEMCINESMRKYPAAHRTNREPSVDVNIGGISVPKGMRIDIPIAAIHYDPEIYPDPDKFIPERFTQEEKQARSQYYFLPFGHGPRNCVGLRLAMLEIKIAIAKILQKMKLVKCDKTEIPVKIKILAPANPIKIRAEMR